MELMMMIFSAILYTILMVAIGVYIGANHVEIEHKHGCVESDDEVYCISGEELRELVKEQVEKNANRIGE